ncbi:hypothetical protein B0H19DRAFT_329035 [Mycena capillaripes]|nr:hypothetical protein B0H19DRAFT_329035 [Mycena capillaripes]
MQLERRLVFSIAEQTIVSFSVTTISQGFGIMYLAAPAFVMQKLALHRSIHARETLTATHDSLASWDGLGSSPATLYSQFSIPASVSGVLTVTAYLACIPILQISTPAIFYVNAFHSTRPLKTRALPNMDRCVRPLGYSISE